MFLAWPPFCNRTSKSCRWSTAEGSLGAGTTGPVEAVEFDAAVVRDLCESDPVLGRAVYRYVAETVADRLHHTRVRLLDLYGPQGSGPNI